MFGKGVVGIGVGVAKVGRIDVVLMDGEMGN